MHIFQIEQGKKQLISFRKRNDSQQHPRNGKANFLINAKFS